MASDSHGPGGGGSAGGPGARHGEGPANGPLGPEARPGSGPPPGERRHAFDDPKNVKRVVRWLLIACALVFALDLVDLVQGWLGAHELRHPERSWEGLPGFYAIYGFVACVLLVLAAKEMRKFLMRDEDYYDR